MTLDEYEQWIEEVAASTLTPVERAAALHLLGIEIGNAAWQGHAQKRAQELVHRTVELGAEAQRLDNSGADLLDGMDGLATRGLLALKVGS